MTISATVIADSLSPHGKRITTLQLRYPRFIHAEFMTHRAFSRNASSSRAIPVERMIEDIIADTAMPSYWGANQKGMQAGDEINEPITDFPFLVSSDRLQVWGFGEYARTWPGVPDVGSIGSGNEATREQAWNDARDYAISIARGFHRAGYHKQVVNRLLEPFMHINVVVTATEWDNFFHLRDHPDAEPHIQELAQEIKASMVESDPIHMNAGEWHLPYIGNYASGDLLDAIKVSVARCARVSYLTHDGRHTNWEEDIDLYDRLVRSDIIHASPTEHQAEADDKAGGEWLTPKLHGNFIGWNQYRKTLAGENYSSEPSTNKLG